MLTFDALTARRAAIDESADLTALRYHQMVRARPIIESMPPVPKVKALLSRDGGVCPDDGTALEFNPWDGNEHRCPKCGRNFSGPRHHAHWARAQHLWLAERAAHLATLHALTDDEAACSRARDILAAYYDLYFELPNSDNVLGPSHLFFSTYLESIWILDYLAAAFILREVNALDEVDLEKIDAIANEAATIIAEFNEGMSNRQTWNSAALTAISAWFGDEELAVSSIEGRYGLLGHLADGFGTDGMWAEGENYHLFALRGLLIGMRWAVTAGETLLDDDALAAHLGDALMAPTDTALPDLTFPARKDSRFGVSLAHPAYIECWEAGFAMLGDRAPAELPSWLHALYRVEPRPEGTYDAYLHDAGQSLPAQRNRSSLSWWALLTMAPELPAETSPWNGGSQLLEEQQLGVMRHGQRYVSLECGGGGGGHGHPDRLNLTLFADKTHWLPDPGTGSYTARDLFWYRSTLAHNAPLLGGHDQPDGDTARCMAFDVKGNWAWCVGAWGDVRRTVISCPRWTLDIVHLDSAAPKQLEVPWHFAGSTDVATNGTWEAGSVSSDFVGAAERFVQGTQEPVVLSSVAGEASLRTWFVGDGELLRASGPGLPGSGVSAQFLLRRFSGNTGSMVTLLDSTGEVTAVTWNGSVAEIHDAGRRTTVQVAGTQATITEPSGAIELGGAQPAPIPMTSFVRDKPIATLGEALLIDIAPAVNGALADFDCSSPLRLNEEHHYFRSESDYPGEEAFSATAFVNWDHEGLYVGVDVVKDAVVLRDESAAPLNFDNEPEDINADGVQVYWRNPAGEMRGWLLSLRANGSVVSRAIVGGSGDPASGAWTKTPGGYLLTVKVPCPDLMALRRGERLGFDVIVNEMREGRSRRSGQLVWSGGPGWVYLRGDRHDPAAFGELELLG